jgi:hypothetical protein
VTTPIHADCKTCPFNAWGSDVDPRTGQERAGKRCKERRRIALISTQGLTEEMLANPDVRYVKPPVTSSKNWDAYVHFVKASVNRPPFAVVTKFSTKPDKDNQFTCMFQLNGPVPNELIPSVIEAYKTFHAADTIMFPYASNNGVAAPAEEAAEAPSEPAPAPVATRPVPRPLPRPAPAKKF